ncbi:MAG: hypothetical protein U9P14_05425 [Gemmatimonadota bacterium]|nr:hypothetical protein [Gemmatimonadota bacterium]
MMNTKFSRSNRSFEQGQRDYLESVNWDRFSGDLDYKLGVLIQHQELRHKKAGYQL